MGAGPLECPGIDSGGEAGPTIALVVRTRGQVVSSSQGPFKLLTAETLVLQGKEIKCFLSTLWACPSPGPEVGNKSMSKLNRAPGGSQNANTYSE